MLKRSHRDVDLPSLVPPQFCAASEAKRSRAHGRHGTTTTTTTTNVPAGTKAAMRRSPSSTWDAALLSAYVVEADPPRGPAAGLGMGLEIIRAEPEWTGSWASHGDYMRFIFGGPGGTKPKKISDDATPERSPRDADATSPASRSVATTFVASGSSGSGSPRARRPKRQRVGHNRPPQNLLVPVPGDNEDDADDGVRKSSSREDAAAMAVDDDDDDDARDAPRQVSSSLSGSTGSSACHHREKPTATGGVVVYPPAAGTSRRGAGAAGKISSAAKPLPRNVASRALSATTTTTTPMESYELEPTGVAEREDASSRYDGGLLLQSEEDRIIPSDASDAELGASDAERDDDPLGGPERLLQREDGDEEDSKAIERGARRVAARKPLRRGFFANALKRRLEVLRDENRRLKRVAAEVLDDHERIELFADLGTEQNVAVADASGSCYDDDDALTRVPSGTVLSSSSPPGSSAADAEDDARRALASVVETTNRVVANPTEVDRRDLTLVKVVQQAQRAFVVTNPALPDNPIVWASDEFARLTGYARDEVCGRNCRFLQGPRTNPTSVAAVRRAIRDKHEASVVLLNYRKDGSTFWNRFFIAPLRDSRGRITFFVGVQTDVSYKVRKSLSTTTGASSRPPRISSSSSSARGSVGHHPTEVAAASSSSRYDHHRHHRQSGGPLKGLPDCGACGAEVVACGGYADRR